MKSQIFATALLGISLAAGCSDDSGPTGPAPSTFPQTIHGTVAPESLCAGTTKVRDAPVPCEQFTIVPPRRGTLVARLTWPDPNRAFSWASEPGFLELGWSDSHLLIRQDVRLEFLVTPERTPRWRWPGHRRGRTRRANPSTSPSRSSMPSRNDTEVYPVNGTSSIRSASPACLGLGRSGGLRVRSRRALTPGRPTDPGAGVCPDLAVDPVRPRRSMRAPPAASPRARMGATAGVRATTDSEEIPSGPRHRSGRPGPAVRRNAASTAFYKSLNGGSSWSSSNGGMTGLKRPKPGHRSENPSTIYAGTFEYGCEGPCLFKSTNGGGIWVPTGRASGRSVARD